MFKLISKLLVLLIFLSPVKAAHGNTTFNYIIKPRIVSAPDGDTIKIWTKQTPVSVRLEGIDCYETSANPHIKYQRTEGLTDEEIIERGLKAKAEMLKILRGHKDIYLELRGIDKRYGRYVGIFYYIDPNGKMVNINEEMMKTGYCPKYIYAPKKRK